MARLLVLAIAALALAACSQNERGRQIITEQCIAGGEQVEVCECFAKQADAKLDQPLFELIVLGARGQAEEADLAMQELEPQQKAKFSVVVPQIIKACGGEGYLAGS
jgi:hypothetical protein